MSWFSDVSLLLLMQRSLQKSILAFTEDRPITRDFKASKQSFLLSTLPPHSLYCYFSEGLNAEYVKGENMEAVVSEEPQGENFAFLNLPVSGHKSSCSEGLP